MIGSSANPGVRDFAVVGAMVRGRQTSGAVSFDVNPTSRSILEDLTRMGATVDLVRAGARIHQAGRLGCIGMGQVPAGGTNSLRTFPRNFQGRSGSPDDAVFLCSPETAAASALVGEIVDPRDWAQEYDVPYPALDLPSRHSVNKAMLEPPTSEPGDRPLVKGPNIGSLPEFDGLPDRLELPIALKVGDNVSTDEICPAGAAALPHRSNIGRLAEFTFRPVDPEYVDRARKVGDHAVVGGTNYGQGSSREHAAITPRFLGLRLVVARSYARIHWQNLANFGVLACEFVDDADYDRIEAGDVVVVDHLHDALRSSDRIEARVGDAAMRLRHRLSSRQIDMVLAGGVIPILHAQT